MTDGETYDVATLFGLTDELGKRLLEAEAVLVQRRLTVGASVPLPNGGELRFGKWDKAWCLSVVSDGGNACKVQSASRLSRIDAANALPALWLAMLEALKAQTQAAREAVAASQRFVEAMRLSESAALGPETSE